MNFDPPIENRTTEQLIEIIRNSKIWKPEVIEFAAKELQRRGIPVEQQKHESNIWQKLQQRRSIIKAKASYTKLEMLLIILFTPLFLVFRHFNIYYHGKDYKKLNRQGFILFILGFSFWIFLIYLYYTYF